MISADHGLAIVYFLQTDVVKTLLEKGFRVVILTDDGVTEKMRERFQFSNLFFDCLLYTSDAADDLLCVDLGGRRIIKKKKNLDNKHN